MPARKKKPAKARAKRPLDSLKYEVARELNLPKEVFEEGDWGNLSSRQCGAVGGQMVRRMIEAARKAIAEEAAAQAIAGFQSGLGLPLETERDTTPES
ncbi:MAG: alpha/beta-type small acid-soluble spore protein [Candidatus Cloacimonetes bacterium]|nr:alpha/beta-type small acid-soluble spore protein [Candidatus Cloacimonadota bacterium]